MAAASNRGRSLPRARVRCGGCGSGKAAGRGVAGNANMPFAGLLSPAASFEGAFFSAFAAAFLISSPAPLFFLLRAERQSQKRAHREWLHTNCAFLSSQTL